MGGSDIKSLDRIDNNGVMRAWEIFAEKKQRFTSIGSEIRSVHYAIKRAWDGKAYGEYVDQFDNIFYQVDDIGDALTEIADAIKEVIYDSFYVADDSLNQQLLEAQHNTRNGSSGGSGAQNTDYRVLTPRETLYSTIKEAYIPNLAYPLLPARPVLVSTIGKAYQPDMSYHTMNPKPVLSSCLPSARMITLTYRNISQREALSSIIGDALEVDISYIQLALREVLSSTIGEMLVPDLSYTPLQLRSMDAAGLQQCLAFLLDYTASPPNLQRVKNTLMATQVNQIVIQSLAAGRTDEETASLIGEAIVGNIHGEMDAKTRETLVSVLGESVFRKMYGRAPGAESTGAHIDWIDTPPEKFNLGMIRDVVGQIVKPCPDNVITRDITDVARPHGGLSCAFTVKTGAGALTTTGTIIGVRRAIGEVSARKVAEAMTRIADDGNRRTIESCIYKAAAQATGAVSKIVANVTNQIVTGNTVIIGEGASPVTSDTVSSVANGSINDSAFTNISNMLKDWMSQSGRFDFGGLMYPRPDTQWTGYPIM